MSTILSYDNKHQSFTWKSLCFRSPWLWLIHRSNKTGTHSGRCSMRPSNGRRYFSLLRSNASFHLFHKNKTNDHEDVNYLSWAMIVKQTCFCFFKMAKSKNVSLSALMRNSADLDRRRSTHSGWPVAAAQCNDVIPKRLTALMRWGWAWRIVWIVERWPLAAASCRGVFPS